MKKNLIFLTIVLIIIGIGLFIYYSNQNKINSIKTTGIITELSTKYQSFLLVNDNPKTGEFDKIYLRPTKNVKVYDEFNKKVTFAYLENDMSVKVTIGGAVRESYPPQGDASIIKVIKR